MSDKGTGSNDRLITRSFVLVSLSSFVFYGGFYLTMSTLPLYLESLDGTAAQIGLVVGAFMISSFAVRFVVGPRLDKRGRREVLIGGMAIFALAILLFTFTNSVLTVFLVRILQGVGWGSANTAVNTVVADLSPPKRRGEAMGIFGAIVNVAMAVGPGMGLALALTSGFNTMFLTAFALAALGALVTMPVVETRSTATGESFLPGGLLSGFNRDVLQPSVTMFLASLTLGVLTPFLPLYANASEVGLYYLVYSVVLLGSRPLTGRLSDRFGRKAVLAPSLVVMASAMAVLSISNELRVILATAVLYAVGFGSVFPTLSALSVDVCDDNQRGTAMATLTAAFDLGIAVGSMLFGLVINAVGFQLGFLGAAAMGIIAFGYFVVTAPSRLPAQEP